MPELRPWAYGCSPFGHNPLTGQVATHAEMADHTALAQQLARAIWDDGYFPILPHLYAPQFLDDHEPADRAYAIDWGLELLGRCEVLYVYDAVPPTSGMQHEIAWARERGIPIRCWRPAMVAEMRAGEDAGGLMDAGVMDCHPHLQRAVHAANAVRPPAGRGARVGRVRGR